MIPCPALTSSHKGSASCSVTSTRYIVAGVCCAGAIIAVIIVVILAVRHRKKSYAKIVSTNPKTEIEDNSKLSSAEKPTPQTPIKRTRERDYYATELTSTIPESGEPAYDGL